MTNGYQKDFKKIFDQLCRVRNRNTVWNDFLTVSAISIANACAFNKDREDLACKILERYSKEEKNQLAGLLSNIISALDEDPRQDYLGSICHEMSLNNKSLGQIFTPYNVADFMVRFVFHDETTKPYITVNDPACGYGVTIIAARNFYMEKGFDPHRKLFCIAQDIDFGAAMGCYIQMSLLGVAGYVRVGDTLANPPTGNALAPEEDVWYTPMYFLPEWQIRRMLYL